MDPLEILHDGIDLYEAKNMPMGFRLTFSLPSSTVL